MTKKRGRPRKSAAEIYPLKKQIPNIVVSDHGTKCPHCGNCYDHKITNTYSNGNRRAKCGKCGKPMIIRRVKTETL